jgi:hypothetical protein
MTVCPVPFETLVALWAGELGDLDAASIDEHIFGCEVCSAASDRLAGVVGGLRESIPIVISHAHRDRLLAQGTRVQVTPVELNVTARARFGPDVDLMVWALRGDLSRAERVDVAIVSPTGTPRVELENVPFDRERGEVLIACQRHFEGMFPGDPVFQVHAVEGGERSPVGDFVVVHEWR